MTEFYSFLWLSNIPVCVWVFVYTVLVAQSCLTLPSSSVNGIFQARRLEWLGIPSPGDFPDPGIKHKSPALQADSLLSVHIYICGILLIHSSVHGQHLGWYHILAIVNNSDMNIGMHVSFQVTVLFCFVFSQLYTWGEIFGSNGNFIFSFTGEPTCCLPQWLCQFTFTSTMCKGFLFSMSLPTFVICRLWC